uniref:HECT domain-containing protein n=2 Tax=Clytia hemisphaerica TaxID=252671 RepID=A0A7M5VC19_9CNID
MDSAAARNTSFEYSTNHVNNQLSSLIAPASIEDSTYSTVSHNTSLVASSSNDQLLSSIAPNSIQDSTDSVVSRNTSVELAASSSNDQLLSSIDSTSIHDLTMDEEVLVAKSATIHRIKIVEDLIELFMDHSIMGYNLEFHVIDARGKEEKGIGIGVTRDVFTSFWNKFGVTNCTGFAEKVPIVRHTMTKKHWEAVGKILIYGKKIGYFPIAISSIFITHTLFGEESISEADVIDGFWKFVSPEDKICIEEFMLKDTDESRKRLLQILGQFQLHTKPTSENVLGLINEIAFQELIQKPNYIANIFRAVFYKCNKTIFATVESIQNFYLDKAPTNRKVIEHLSYREPETLNQRNTLDYLIKFLRELSKADLLRFLTFVTALDLIGEDKILINIVPEKQTPRGPLSRTCVPSLTLQDDYESYNVFEQEFKDILNSKYAYSFHFG